MSDFDRIHAICVRLRNQQCNLCPHSFIDPHYGESMLGCRALAEECAAIAIHGNPWGEDAPAKHVARWQERFNNE